MNKYILFDYHPRTLLGESIEDALMRQGTLTTPTNRRRIDTGIPGVPSEPGWPDRYIWEETGGEKITIARVIEIVIDKNSRRGDKKYETAICELADGKIIEVDYCEEQPGRSTLYGEAMRQTAIYLPEHMRAWLVAKPGNISETIRDLIQAAMGYEKLEDKMTEEKIISFDDFCDWHTANDTDRVPQEKLSEAYDVYMQLFVEGGKEYADEKITGHPIWNS